MQMDELTEAVYADEQLGLTVFEVRAPTPLLVKTYQRPSIEAVDPILKSVFFHVRSSSQGWDGLNTVVLTRSASGLAVNLVFSHPAEALMRRNDGDMPGCISALEGYEMGRLLSDVEGVSVREAWGLALETDVTVTSFPASQLEHVNSRLSEALIQSKVAHKHNLQVIDVAADPFSVHIVTESGGTVLTQELCTGRSALIRST